MLAGPDKDLFNQFDRQRVGFLFSGAYSRCQSDPNLAGERRASQRQRYETVRFPSIRNEPYWFGASTRLRLRYACQPQRAIASCHP